MKSLTQNEIAADLRRLGLRAADTVMLHSSLSSLGLVEGGAEAVVAALLEASGPGGTLVAPAFQDDTWSERPSLRECAAGCPRPFCPSKMPGSQGAIAEVVRQHPGSVRSCHPTHSWVAVGQSAPDLVCDHYRSATPCGPGNPFEPLLQRDGCIVALGVGVNSITLFHYLEDILEVPYLGVRDAARRHITYTPAGKRIQYEFPGLMEEVLKATGVMKLGRVGRATARLLRARDFRQFLVTIFNNDPYCLVLRPPDRTSDNLLLDALQKASSMLRAWSRGPQGTLVAIQWPKEAQGTVREDCPAFAGYGALAKLPDAAEIPRRCTPGKTEIPLCKANNRHPLLFREGDLFNRYGVAFCGKCSWHRSFPWKQPMGTECSK
jgi:aminoglycoside 3-N-acetyltransferase